MDVVHEILDKQVVGRRQTKMGKVDGIVMVLEPGRPPRLGFIEMGGVTMARRLPGAWGRCMAWLARRLSPKGGKPYRIPWSRITSIGLDVEVDLDAGRTPALASERWVRDHIIQRIPGA